MIAGITALRQGQERITFGGQDGLHVRAEGFPPQWVSVIQAPYTRIRSMGWAKETSMYAPSRMRFVPGVM